MKTFPGSDLCYCLAARRGSRFITRIYDRHLAAVQLSFSQFSLLVLIYEHPGITLSTLAELMVMERTTLLRTIKPLRTGDWVMCEPQGAKKILAFTLSALGEVKFQEAHCAWADAQKELEQKIGQDAAVSLRNQTLSIVFPR